MKSLKHQEVEERLFELTESMPPSQLVFLLHEFAHELLVTGYPRERGEEERECS